MERDIDIFPELIEQQINVEIEPFLLTKTQDKTVALDMAEGDQVIHPDGDSLLQSVTVEKPDTFIPENIKKDVEIGGVTGEYEIVLPPLNNPADEEKVIEGYEYFDGVGIKRTGSFVPPVDTGANGLYKDMIEEEPITQLIDDSLTALRSYAQYGNTSLVKVSLPNVTTVKSNAFASCSNITGIIDLNKAALSTSVFYSALRRTVVLKIAANNQGIQSSNAVHLWLPNGYTRLANYEYRFMSNLKSIQYDNMKSSLSFVMSGGLTALKAFVIRKNTLIPLAGTGLNGYDASVFRFYVPTSLLNNYKTATNWTSYAQYIVGIDQDTTVTVGTLFTPTTSATVDHFDMVELQSYSVGTVDTVTGTITPTHDGRLLIRGLDANDEIVHVTYLQIGTGFDEEANLL